jgi:hypothetical protein
MGLVQICPNSQGAKSGLVSYRSGAVLCSILVEIEEPNSATAIIARTPTNLVAL